MLDPAQSAVRADRVVEILRRRDLDALVVGRSHHVYYLTAYLSRWVHMAGAIVFADGSTCLIKSDKTSADGLRVSETIDYAADFLYTLRQEQGETIAKHVIDALRKRGAKRIGVDASAPNAPLVQGFEGEIAPFESDLWQLRRRKDADELALMSKAIRCAEAMFRCAREIIKPGVQELDVFGTLHAAAVAEAGEPLSGMLGNDYACGTMGGPPRANRAAQSGEIYILDVGPPYRGYFSDVTRAFAVDRKPTDAQLRAWDALAGAMGIVEQRARPGVRCRDLFHAVEEHLCASHGRGLAHHLGHGVGLDPHEYPHLNPHWDDVLTEGEIITCEPGLYGAELGGGIRLENQYLITASGARNLIDFPLELA